MALHSTTSTISTYRWCVLACQVGNHWFNGIGRHFSKKDGSTKIFEKKCMMWDSNICKGEGPAGPFHDLTCLLASNPCNARTAFLNAPTTSSAPGRQSLRSRPVQHASQPAPSYLLQSIRHQLHRPPIDGSAEGPGTFSQSKTYQRTVQLPAHQVSRTCSWVYHSAKLFCFGEPADSFPPHSLQSQWRIPSRPLWAGEFCRPYWYTTNLSWERYHALHSLHELVHFQMMTVSCRTTKSPNKPSCDELFDW